MTLETKFAGAYIFPVTDGAANTVLATDGSGNVDWQTLAALGAVTQLSDLSDVNSSDDTAYKVLIADGSGFDSGFLDRVYDVAGTNYIEADYKSGWYSTRNGMEFKSGTEDLLLRPASSSGMLVLDAKHVLIADAPEWMDAPKLVVRASAGDHISGANQSYGSVIKLFRGVGEALGATTITGALFNVEDNYSGASHIYTYGMVSSVDAFPAIGTTMNYVIGQSNSVSVRDGAYGGVTTTTGAVNEARVSGSNSQTYDNVTGVTAFARLYGSTANATIFRAASFMSSDDAGSGASAIGAVTSYEHYGIYGTAQKAAGSTFGTQYGVRIPDLNTAVTNYGIHIAAFTDTVNDWGVWSGAKVGIADDIPLIFGTASDYSIDFDSTTGDLDIVGDKVDITGQLAATGIWLNITNVAVDTLLTTTHDTVIVDCNGADRTITLGAAASFVKKIYTVVKEDTGAYSVTIDPDGTELIGYSATQSLVAQGDAITFQSDGTEWHIL